MVSQKVFQKYLKYVLSGTTPTSFLVYLHSFKTTILGKNFGLQRDSNLDRQGRRQER